MGNGARASSQSNASLSVASSGRLSNPALAAALLSRAEKPEYSGVGSHKGSDLEPIHGLTLCFSNQAEPAAKGSERLLR
ncbi:MAG: hypothetical protein WC681_04205 [Sterolibacterium sp.]